MLASEVINPKDIEVTMDDIGGLTDILAALVIQDPLVLVCGNLPF